MFESQSRVPSRFWSDWTFTFKPEKSGTLMSAALQVDKGQAGDHLTICILYLKDALYTVQDSPTNWWKIHRRSLYYLMKINCRELASARDFGWLEIHPQNIIPWLNLKLGHLEQAAESLAQRESARVFLRNWRECSQIQENPRCD